MRIRISVPNVAFAPILAQLMSGAWTCTDRGILERTHIRFFANILLQEVIASLELRQGTIYHLCRSPFLMHMKLLDYHGSLPALSDLQADPLAFTYEFLAICRCTTIAHAEPLVEHWIDLNTRLVRRHYALMRTRRQGL
jgi:hypothetical protein